MGWDLSRQTYTVKVRRLKTQILFLNPQRVALTVFSGPYLPRRVAQSAWEFSAIGCSSSATSHEVCGLLGRVSMDAHDDEQRRIKAEARVHFFWLLILWANKEK